MGIPHQCMPVTVTTATTTIPLAKVTITRPNTSPVQRVATATVTSRQGTTSLLLINVSTVSTISSTLLGILIREGIEHEAFMIKPLSLAPATFI